MKGRLYPACSECQAAINRPAGQGHFACLIFCFVPSRPRRISRLKCSLIARTGSIEQPGFQVTLPVSVGPFRKTRSSNTSSFYPIKCFATSCALARSATGSTLTNLFLKMNISVGSKTPSNMNFLSANWGNFWQYLHPLPPSALVRMAPQSYRRTTRCQDCQH